MVCPKTTEGNHKGVTDQRKTSRYYLLSLSELSLVLRCLWRFILTHPRQKKKVDGNHSTRKSPAAGWRQALHTEGKAPLWRAFRHINNPSSATTFYFCKQLLDHDVTCETEHPQDQHASAGQSWLEILQKGTQPASWILAGREHGSALGGDLVSHLFSQRKSCHGGGR